MPNNYIRTLVYQFKDVFERKIGVIDENGFIISPSNPKEIDASVESILEKCAEGNTVYRFAGCTFLSFGKQKTEYITFAVGEDEEALKCCRALGVSVASVKSLYDEKYDRGNFIKNIILDNILPGDIYAKARELNIAQDTSRVVFNISKEKLSADEVNVRKIIEGIYPDSEKDFVITVDNENIVLVKEVDDNVSPEKLEGIAKTIFDNLQSEALITVTVGIGTVVRGVPDLAKSYKEAQIAIEVGKAFDEEKNVINYENLGIGRLIYQMPTTLCELFLSEVFKTGSIDSLDRETLLTIQKFFENNLNVSETSRQLYVHRNTLVYRLDKVQKITGLDLRILDHAIVFKVAMMVKKYLNNSQNRY
ncbi:MAG: helix-turn-helix domain-containing protein [Clostridia bacterium]|nr:helix-turn-helix domain-containing protein [Clostridia bacterium]